ncbi:unnamed protein product [Symbiodinium necroappetens]|uniref:Uncharacterized protein n=1 Tax=Symbiodinium necroappetens TaxID=1628268 RepID=A0A812JI88_9DINO|nr:unnamed protein product [Symbiodinium necroappetens]
MDGEDTARSVALQEMKEVWGGLGTAMQAEPDAQKRPSEPEKEEERPDKWRKAANKGQQGKGNPWGSWRSWERSGDQDPWKLDPATLHLLRTLVKTTLRLDEDVSRYRADCNFMLFVDSVSEAQTLQVLRAAAEKWQEAYTNGRVTTSLRVVLFCGLLQKLKEAVGTVQTDDGVRDRLLRVGWLEDGVNALLPSWHYFRWDPKTQRQVVSEREPLPQDKLLRCLDVLEKGCCNPATLLRFRSTHKLGQETQAEVVPFMLSLSLRGAMATECHEALSLLAYSGALKMLGLRLRPERVQQSTAARELTEAYLNAPFTDWTRRQQQNLMKPAASGANQNQS